MGRPKGSKNGVRKVLLRKIRVDKYVEESDSCESVIEDDLPVFCKQVLKKYRDGNYQKCVDLIEKLLENNSDENKDHYKILQAASFTMLGKDFELSHSILDEVLASDPKNSSAWYGKGVAFYFEKRFDESLLMFDEAIKNNSQLESHRSNDMKIRIDIERRSAVIRIQKMEQEVFNLPSDFVKFVEGYEESDRNAFDDYECQQAIDAEGKLEIANISDEEFAVKAESHEQQATVEYEMLDLKTQETCKKQQIVKTETRKLSTSLKYEQLDAPTSASDFFTKGMAFYSNGLLEDAIKMFGNAYGLDPTQTKAEEMATKAEELDELLDTAKANLDSRNYEAVVQIANEALEIDPENNYVNRQFYYHRGLALYHLGNNKDSLKDYAELERIDGILC